MDKLKKFIEVNSNLMHLDLNKIRETIEDYFKVNINQVNDYQILKGGYMNPLFTFNIDGEKYVYRYPGLNTEKFIHRPSEKKAHIFANEIGLDDSLLFISDKGHKITTFIENARYLDYGNKNDLEAIINIMNLLHSQKKTIGYEFNVAREIEDYWTSLSPASKARYPNLESLKATVLKILEEVSYSKSPKILCHNDIYAENILINNNNIYLIDWEFSKDTHPALDLATFIVCSPYTMEEVDEILRMYLLEDYNIKRTEFIKYFTVSSLYWLLWAIYTEENGESTNGLLENYYNFLQMFLTELNDH